MTKLRANNSPDTHQTRKAVRATLILIPLLGLHYILTPFRPEAKSEWEGIYESIAAVCTSFQGLCVAMLFCFCNGEVMSVIKKKIKSTFNLKGGPHFNDNYYLSNNNYNNVMRSRSNTVITTTAQLNFKAPLNSVSATTTTTSLHNAGLRSSSIAYLEHSSKASPMSLNQKPIYHQSNGTASNSGSVLTNITASPLQTGKQLDAVVAELRDIEETVNLLPTENPTAPPEQ